jgi:transposase
VTDAAETLPTDLAAAHAMILAERAARLAAESDRRILDIEIERLKLEIARLERERYGQSAERSARIEQLELSLEDLEETAAACEAAVVSDMPPSQPRRKPAPESCPCCGGELSRLGEDVTETLERVPAQWRVIQHVREKFSCRSCAAITQPPAPFHPISRGRAGAGLLAEVVFNKFGLHLPLHRQSERFVREGVEIDVSTLADWVGAVSVALKPLIAAIADHVRAGPRVHVDDTPVPVLAKGKTKTGRLWTMVRDDRPFGGNDPPAAAYAYSPDRGGEHAETLLGGFAGIMQAEAFAGFNRLYEKGAVVEAACWAHSRRKFYELAQLKKAPIAIEAVARIDALFAIERDIAGLSAEERQAVRAERSRPLVDDLAIWLHAKRAGLSGKSDSAKAMNYLLKRWPAFNLFLADGRVDLSDNTAERALRGIAIGRRNWTFAGSDAGGRRAAVELAANGGHRRMTTKPEQIARLRISLDEIEPEIWRRVEVPLDFPLKSLHNVIQAVMGGEEYHLFEFHVGDKNYGIPNPDDATFGHRVMNAKTTKLATILGGGINEFEYVYDFGDDWRHRIVVEAIEPARPNQTSPNFLDGARRGPPEDVGSLPGYYEFIEAVTSPKHPARRRMIEWYGGVYDPDDIDEFTISLRIGAIVKRRRAGKAAYAKRKG